MLTKSIQNEINKQLNFLISEVKKEKTNDLLTKKDVSKMLQISLSTVNRWMALGSLKAFGIEGRVYFKKIDVEDLLIPIN